MFQPPPTLNFHTATPALEAGLRAISNGQTAIDLGQLTAVDSAALATLLAWQRAARARGTGLTLLNIPANLRGLAELYGVSEFL